MKLPKKVKIFNYDFEFMFCELNHENDNIGQILYREKKIKLDSILLKKENSVRFAETVLHEIQHGILYFYVIDGKDRDSEEFNTVLARAWIKTYQDNPWLLGFIKENIHE